MELKKLSEEATSLINYCLFRKWKSSVKNASSTHFWCTAQPWESLAVFCEPTPRTTLCKILLCLAILNRYHHISVMKENYQSIISAWLGSILECSQDSRRSNEKEVSLDVSKMNTEFTHSSSTRLLKKLIQIFLFSYNIESQPKSYLRKFEENNATILDVKKKDAQHFQEFCSTVSHLLTLYGIANTENESVKTTFILQEQSELYQGSSETKPSTSLRPIGNLLVTRNELSGKVECFPYESTDRNFTSRDFYLKQIHSRHREQDENHKRRIQPSFKGNLAARRIAQGLLFIFNSRKTCEQLETWGVEMAGYAIPLVLRLVNVQDIKCQIDSLTCLNRILWWTSSQVITQFYPPLWSTLQRNYPTFLDHTCKSDHLRKVKIYFRVALHLLKIPHENQTVSLVFPCMEFLFKRIHLSVLHSSEQLLVVLNAFHFLISHTTCFLILYQQELFKMAIQAMENSNLKLNLSAIDLLVHLINRLPRFCTERYWKDLCVRVCLVNQRFRNMNGKSLPKDIKNSFPKRLSNGLEALIQAMAQRTRERPLWEILSDTQVPYVPH